VTIAAVASLCRTLRADPAPTLEHAARSRCRALRGEIHANRWHEASWWTAEVNAITELLPKLSSLERASLEQELSYTALLIASRATRVKA
jgi:hypothetical protein